MYTFQSRVRYSELDPERKLSIASIVDYFQDCSTFHSEQLGVGLDYMGDVLLADCDRQISQIM